MRFLQTLVESFQRIWFFFFDRFILYSLINYLSQSLEIRFMNLGYWPTEDSAEDDCEIKKLIENYSLETDLDRPHYFLYERALKFHGSYPSLEGLRILEVGCGQGKGLEWIEKLFSQIVSFFSRIITGTSRAHPKIKSIIGVDRCALPNHRIILGDAHNLPVQDSQIDIVLNVESSHLYSNCDQFFRECSRILRKQGYLCWTDLRHQSQVSYTRAQAIRAGFVEERWEDVTNNILEGIKHTSARYDEILAKAPLLIRFFSSSLRATYCAPGTHTYKRFSKKEKGYYVALWKKTAQD
ncbi:methyltransferase domain protein [Dictyocaulus viviparus]|uniref:Methyltransferase domain protein n=1 Tax=Dictyocaulus viviparus TaxID=29172 RepID=A0A0D8XNV7_DICVI|nr:methyltransferase domain protein [Dictyocaulus viviparus]